MRWRDVIRPPNRDCCKWMKQENKKYSPTGSRDGSISGRKFPKCIFCQEPHGSFRVLDKVFRGGGSIPHFCKQKLVRFSRGRNDEVWMKVGHFVVWDVAEDICVWSVKAGLRFWKFLYIFCEGLVLPIVILLRAMVFLSTNLVNTVTHTIERRLSSHK